MIGCSIAAAGREQADMARSTLFALAAGFQLAAVAALPIPLGDASWRCHRRFASAIDEASSRLPGHLPMTFVVLNAANAACMLLVFECGG